MFCLALLFVNVFFCHFSILITLLGEERACLCAYRAFVSNAHVNLCHLFSSYWCQGLAAASACSSSWTFLFTFMQMAMQLCSQYVRYRGSGMIKSP